MPIGRCVESPPRRCRLLSLLCLEGVCKSSLPCMQRKEYRGGAHVAPTQHPRKIQAKQAANAGNTLARSYRCNSTTVERRQYRGPDMGLALAPSCGSIPPQQRNATAHYGTQPHVDAARQHTAPLRRCAAAPLFDWRVSPRVPPFSVFYTEPGRF